MLVILAEVMLGGSEAELACLRASRSGSFAWALMMGYLVLSVVLLLNVVIAAMAKTFDLIYEVRRAQLPSDCAPRCRARPPPTAPAPPPSALRSRAAPI